MKIDPRWLYLVSIGQILWVLFAIVTNFFFGIVWLPDWAEVTIILSILPTYLVIDFVVDIFFWEPRG